MDTTSKNEKVIKKYPQRKYSDSSSAPYIVKNDLEKQKAETLIELFKILCENAPCQSQ